MDPIYQYIGYAGSVLIAVSLMMKNILRLRVINFFGAATFAFYGYLVGAYPVLILNGFITLVDVYYLSGMLREKEHFSLMPVLDSSHRYLKKFIEFYREDIKRFFPEFKLDSIENSKCFFILRNLRPAGLFIYERVSEEEAFIHLDYAIPDYRDFKNARFVYSAQQKYLMDKGVIKLKAKSMVDKHIKYLKNTGFVQNASEADMFEKSI